MSCTPEQYIDEYGEPPPGLEGYAHHNGHHKGIKSGYRNPVHALMKNVKSYDPQSIISGYRHTNQDHYKHHNGHHDGHHDGHHKENYAKPCFSDKECHGGSCQNKSWMTAGAGFCK